jgi:hypothetical protein
MTVSRRVAGAGLLVAASIALHAMVIGGLSGQWAGSHSVAPVVRQAPVQVVMVSPPPAPVPPAATPAPAPVPPAARPVRPRPAAPKPAPAASRAPASPDAAQAPTLAAATPADPGAAVHPTDFPSHDGDTVETGGSDAAASGTAGAAGGPERAGANGASPLPDAAPAPAQPEPVPGPVANAPSAVPPAAEPPRPPLPALPGSRTQRFRVYWGDFSEQRSVARLQYHLTNDGDHYRIRTEAQAEGLISLVYSGTLVQESSGRLGADGLEPLRYAEQRGKRAERFVRFDPAGQRLLPAGGVPTVALPPGTQDRLSVFYQIGLVARSDPAGFVAGRSREVPVASLRTVETQRFDVIGDEVLMTPGGPVRALHLRRLSPPGKDDPLIDLWLGYDFEMLPVRLRIEDASRRVLDQVIERDG